MIADPAAGRILRAKYLDWCSARVADQFLELTPDEIYELAHEAIAAEAGGAGVGVSDGEPNGSAGTDEDRVASYRQLVQRATEALSARIDLPSFEEWSTAYAEAPEDFDRDMLGFWKEEGGGEDSGED